MAQQQMSLFGPSAFDIQRQQAQQDQANAVTQAQLTPFQSIRASALMSGTQAGRSLAGLFGIEDPALSEAKKMQELKAAVAAQWDGNDPLEAYKIFAKEASARGLTQAAIGAATQVKAFEAEREKTALSKREAEARIGLTETQTKSVKGTEERAVTKFAWEEQDRPLQQAIKDLEFTKNVQDINLRNAQLTEAQIKLESAQAEWNALTPKEREEQAKSKAKLSMDKLKLEIDKLKADIKAAKALATYRERPPGVKRIGAIPIRDNLDQQIGLTVFYNDGTQKDFFGNAGSSTKDTASQAARGMTPGSNILDQLKQPLLEERRRRDQERKNQPGAR